MSTRTIRVEVTADDIAAGVRRSTCRCPVARALSSLFPGENVRVSFDTMAVFKPGGDNLKRWSTPREVVRFIETFDAGSTSLKPFAFDLELTEAA